MMFSFIIPAHNEAKLLPATMDSVHQAAKAVGCEYEIIVADDASDDETAQVASAHGAKVVTVDHRQISKTRNSGAAVALGDVFIFVDADTQIDPAVLRSVADAIQNSTVGGGAPIRFDGQIAFYGRVLMPFFVFLYQRLMRYAYGCFVFCTREAFEAVGGFDETLFASEEISISRALKKQGRFTIIKDPVVTSGRKLRTYSFLEALRILLRYVLGGGQRSLRKRDHLNIWYGPRREDPGA